MAASDPTRTIAAPHATIPHPGPPAEPPEALLRLLEALEPVEVVVGIPLRMDGSEGEMAAEARAFGRRLAERTGLPVIEWDERLTTARAERELRAGRRGTSRGRSGTGRSPRHSASRRGPGPPPEKGAADRVAAALILRTYLASRAER